MAIQHILTDDFRHTGFYECLSGLFVHIQYGAVLGTDSDGYIGILKIISFHYHNSDLLKTKDKSITRMQIYVKSAEFAYLYAIRQRE